MNIFKYFKANPVVLIEVRLHCPDGLDEYLSFYVPEELDDLLEFCNRWSKDPNYSFTLSKKTT